MKRAALVIMAAGIGSRFGGGIKQLEPVGLNGEIIIDYSIHDAIEAGFNKIVIIIRKDIEADFKERIGNRVESICKAKGVEFEYVYQRLEDVPSYIPNGRTKPWGTGQAVLAAREAINCPFAVLNADDYYGKEAFQVIYDFLVNEVQDTAFCMAGFLLKNTLSEYGGVTRGVCTVDQNHMLTDIVETSNIEKCDGYAQADGKKLDLNTYVSMNIWGMSQHFIDMLKMGFEEFFVHTVPINPLKAEYLLPVYIGKLLDEKKITVKVLETKDKWFGVTYKEDKPFVVESFRKLIAEGVYKEELYSDL